jgi:hypothetical protein
MQRDTEEKVKKRRKIDTNKRGNLKKKKKKKDIQRHLGLRRLGDSQCTMSVAGVTRVP